MKKPKTSTPQPLPASGFGTLLKQWRKELGISQKFVAEQSGYSQPYVSMIENGDREPTLETINAYCKVLGIEVKIFYEIKK